MIISKFSIKEVGSIHWNSPTNGSMVLINRWFMRLNSGFNISRYRISSVRKAPTNTLRPTRTKEECQQALHRQEGAAPQLQSWSAPHLSHTRFSTVLALGIQIYENPENDGNDCPTITTHWKF